MCGKREGLVVRLFQYLSDAMFGFGTEPPLSTISRTFEEGRVVQNQQMYVAPISIPAGHFFTRDQDKTALFI
jgi:hypothetical protein